MGFLPKIFYKFSSKNEHQSGSKKSDYIFYKIVDSSDENYTLQCINTDVIFHAQIFDIVFDIDILHGLHPIQACYVGIEYCKYLNKTYLTPNTSTKKLNKYSIFRYGNYNLSHQDREGNVCFICNNTNKRFTMDTRDIALSKDLISEFDAAQAFHIGLLAGLKINNSVTKNKIFGEAKKPYLRIVK